MQRIREYYKNYGLWKLIVKLISLIGIIIKREYIYFEIKLQDTTPYKISPRVLELDFVQVKKNDFEQYDFPNDEKFMTKNQAFRRLTGGNHILLALTNGSKIVGYVFAELNTAHIPGGLLVQTPDNVVYSSAMYTVPEFRGKGLALKIKLLQFHFLQEQGYHKEFFAIKPHRKASLKVVKKCGYKEYQTVFYSKIFFLKYYCVKDYDTKKRKRFLYIKGIDQKLWDLFSKI